MKRMVLLFMVCCFALVGCNEEKTHQKVEQLETPQKNQSQKIIGFWRCEKPTRGGFHNLTFTEKELLTGTAEPGSSYMVTYDIRDNMITVRQSGTDHVLFTVDFIDDNKIKTTYDIFCPAGGVFVRSSQDETNLLNAEWKRNEEQKTRELQEELDKPYRP